MKNPALKYGLLGAVVIVFYFSLLYISKKEHFLSPLLQWGSMVMYLFFMYKAAQEDCAEKGTSRDFREILRTPFTVFLLINLGYWLFYYGLHLADPSLIQTEMGIELSGLKSQLSAVWATPEQANRYRERSRNWKPPYKIRAYSHSARSLRVCSWAHWADSDWRPALQPYCALNECFSVWCLVFRALRSWQLWKVRPKLAQLPRAKRPKHQTLHTKHYICPRMNKPVRIFLSHDAADTGTALDVQRQLKLLVQPQEIVFWDRSKVPAEAFRKQAAAFLEQANLFVAVLSMNYQDTPDVFWEAAQAIATQRGRPALQIVHIQAREAAIPAILQAYPAALPPGETIENQGIVRDPTTIARRTVCAVSLICRAAQQPYARCTGGVAARYRGRPGAATGANGPDQPRSFAGSPQAYH